MEILNALKSKKRVNGLTHNFYKYPARFSPNFAKEVIQKYTEEGDCVLDPFMGGGTTIVEAIAHGRKALGIDINPLSFFVTKAKTTPISDQDKHEIINWAQSLDFRYDFNCDLIARDTRLKNLPSNIKNLLFYLVSSTQSLNFPRQKTFARCALLKLGSWALDCRKDIPEIDSWKNRLIEFVFEMINGLDEFVACCSNNDIKKNKITSQRILIHGSIKNAIKEKKFSKFLLKSKLILTSPPYPGVHILYHRWQVRGRRETPAPFLITNQIDGHGESYYTLGSRTSYGLKKYFSELETIFRQIKQFINQDSLIIQLLAFNDPDNQIPSFLDTMKSSGFKETIPFKQLDQVRPVREVPNRKWYTNSTANNCSSQEILFFHKPH
ncbi:MAG: DNA methyltransferase [Balneolaceae bacterium]